MRIKGEYYPRCHLVSSLSAPLRDTCISPTYNEGQTSAHLTPPAATAILSRKRSILFGRQYGTHTVIRSLKVPYPIFLRFIGLFCYVCIISQTLDGVKYFFLPFALDTTAFFLYNTMIVIYTKNKGAKTI